MQYTWQLALGVRPRARACIFHKTLGLMLYLLRMIVYASFRWFTMDAIRHAVQMGLSNERVMVNLDGKVSG